MTRDSDAFGVQFLAAEVNPGLDEELPEPHRPARRHWGAILFALAVLATGLLVARAFGDSSPDPAPVHRAAPASGPAAIHRIGPTADAPAPNIAPPIDLGARLVDGAACPDAGDGQTICVTSERVPGVVLAAVQDAFPGAHGTALLEERLRDVGLGPGGVWYRKLSARSGGRSITVVVRHRLTSDFAQRGSGDSGEFGVAYAERIVGRLAVVVRATAPSGHVPDLGAVTALARDHRLLAAASAG